MTRKIWLLCIVSIFSMSALFISTSVSANQDLKKQINEMKSEQGEIKDKRSDVKSDLQSAEKRIAAIGNEKEVILKEIKRLDMAVAETQNQIRQKNEEITDTEEEIASLQQEVESLKQRIEQRDEILKERARSVQETGGAVSYLDVLLGAKNFGDFLDRVGSVSIILKQDKDILRSHVEEKGLVEEKKNELSEMLVGLETQLTELETLQTEYSNQKGQKERIMNRLKQQEEEIEGYLLELEEQEEILRKQEEMTKKLVKQLEDELKRQQESNQKPVESNGSFIRPADGPITSKYGQRWGKLHAGLDIGKRGNSVPIKAASSGIVFRSYYSNSYGNVVFITHNVKGQVYTTVYAHMENREVQEGDIVKQGQRLGYMGNTGHSFGAHLHFELHKGPWNMAKSNSVDPTKHIKF